MTSNIAKKRYPQPHKHTDFLKYCSPSAAALGEDKVGLLQCDNHWVGLSQFSSPSAAALGEQYFKKSVCGFVRLCITLFGPPVRSTVGPRKLKCLWFCVSVCSHTLL